LSLVANEFNWGKILSGTRHNHLIPLNKMGNHSERLSERKQRHSRRTNSGELCARL